MKQRLPLTVVDPTANAARLEDRPLAWWLQCKLRTTLSEPRVHELQIPSGERLVLSGKQMLSPIELRSAFLDAVGTLPPLPLKGARVFLLEVVEHLLKGRETSGAS